MLLQEQTTESTLTPRELAQAIVAVEGREESFSGAKLDTGRAAQMVEQLGVDIVPEELLAEVREQRVRAYQQDVMIKRKALDRTAWVFFAGMIGACGVSLFLVWTNYRTYFKAAEMNRLLYDAEHKNALNQGSNEAARQTDVLNTVAAKKKLVEWEYPGAMSEAKVLGDSVSWETLTTQKDFASVCAYYGGLAQAPPPHMPSQFRRALGKPGDPFQSSIRSGANSVDARGVVNPAGVPQTATYTRRTNGYEIIAHVVEGADKTTVIQLISKKP